jgi:hypothetical protein
VVVIADWIIYTQKGLHFEILKFGGDYEYGIHSETLKVGCDYKMEMHEIHSNVLVVITTWGMHSKFLKVWW